MIDLPQAVDYEHGEIFTTTFKPTPPRVVCEGNRSELWNGVKERGLKRYRWVLSDLHLLDL